MTIPIQDLPSAASPLNGNAYAVIKDGATDKKATVTQLRQIDVSAFSLVPSSEPVASDNMILGRSTTTYRVPFTSVGLLKNTKAWFFQSTAPSGWAIDPTASADSLLAVKSNSGAYNTTGANKGTWQQEGHALTIAQMPAHRHTFAMASRQSDSSGTQPHPAIKQLPQVGFTNWAGSAGQQADANGQLHNHGSSWRPLANVGIICYKAV